MGDGRSWVWITSGAAVLAIGAMALALLEHQRAARLAPLWSADEAQPNLTTERPSAPQRAPAFQDLPELIETDVLGERAVVAWPGRTPEVLSRGQRSPDGRFRLVDLSAERIWLERLDDQRGTLSIARRDLGQPARWISFQLPSESVERLVLMPLGPTPFPDRATPNGTAASVTVTAHDSRSPIQRGADR